MEEVAAAIDAVVGDLEGAQDQAGDRVPRVRGAGHVPPGVGRVAGVDADRVAVDAADRLVRLDFPRACGRRRGARAGWRPARSPRRRQSGAIPSASAAAAASAACSGVASKMVLLIRSTQPSSAARVPSGLPTRWYWSSSLGKRTRGRSMLRRVIPVALALDAVADRLAQERVGVLGADQGEQVPGAIGQHDAVDLGVVLDGEQDVVERLVGPAAGERGEGPLGQVQVLAADGVAERLAAGLAGRQRLGRDRVQHLAAALPPPLSWIRLVLRYSTLITGSARFDSGSSRAMWKAGAKAIMVWKPT